MRTYARIYGNLIVVAVLAALGVLVTPALVVGVNGYLPASLRLAGGHYEQLITDGVRLVIVLIAVLVLRTLVRDKDRAAALHEIGLDDSDGAIELYRGFTKDVGVDPSLTRRVIEMNAQMSPEDRGSDFHRANQPNFSAALGHQLGVDGETRAMMRDFFATSAADSRRSFSTSTHVTMEGGRVEQHHETDAVVEPVSRFAPRDPENDPNWRGEVTKKELNAKIFGSWDDELVVVPGSFVEQTPPVIPAPNSSEDAVVLPGFVEGEQDAGEVETPTHIFTKNWEPERVEQHLSIVADAERPADVERPVEEEGVQPLETIPDDELEEEPELEEDDEGGILLASEDGWTEDEILYDGIVRSIAESEPHWALSDETDVLSYGSDDSGNDEPSSGDDEALESEIFTDDDAVFAGVESDPVVAGLINAIGLTRRLPSTQGVHYLYAFYGGDTETLITEFHTQSTTHVDHLGTGVEPLYRYGGVRRHKTSTWKIELLSNPELEDDIAAIVWIPIGIAQLEDKASHTAWKLVGVQAGTSATFHVLRKSADLMAARLEWILGNLYEDLRIDRDEVGMHFFLPNLGVTIDLVMTEALIHGDFDIHGDADHVEGPLNGETHNVPLLGDVGREWMSSRLGIPEIDHNDWLPMINMLTTLVMRVEPVTSKELLAPWAAVDSDRGKDLMAMLRTIFGDSLSNDDDGWSLANVRLDLFWIEELIEAGEVAEIESFFVRKFEAGALDLLFSLNAMDPRMRTSDAVLLEQKTSRVLNDVVKLLSPSATGVLADKLAFISSKVKKG